MWPSLPFTGYSSTWNQHKRKSLQPHRQSLISCQKLQKIVESLSASEKPCSDCVCEVYTRFVTLCNPVGGKVCGEERKSPTTSGIQFSALLRDDAHTKARQSVSCFLNPPSRLYLWGGFPPVFPNMRTLRVFFSGFVRYRFSRRDPEHIPEGVGCCRAWSATDCCWYIVREAFSDFPKARVCLAGTPPSRMRGMEESLLYCGRIFTVRHTLWQI